MSSKTEELAKLWLNIDNIEKVIKDEDRTFWPRTDDLPKYDPKEAYFKGLKKALKKLRNNEKLDNDD